ncbi:hypothetical protein BAUCODRAFT_73063 [Baudoinia panamericana UAMH 10762]|uniref:N-acetyltransferase domain-containing protein n=1 Tax=Baudoinia panamericana (strain UAMH 10762) TaxID=717646 RepID=M2N977_BAUPA|nr:uncharacterized protein BAUCODRAFT_73063 [Baudoinia panamericana UAMH 10762]EMC95375.1 hypothetical protein BAUCODRAFT_73063 [Baudoinia panamericana UAMH 10762]
MRTNVSIEEVEGEEDLATTIKLFEAYAQSLGIDLTFQDFAHELGSMPGKYAPPQGILLLAKAASGDAFGCVGLRPLAGHGYCEMKRLYVAPEGRGLGIGRALAERVVQEARLMAYQAVRLDTLPSMASARHLYTSLGFREVEPYYETPIKGTVFLELDLAR